MAVSRVTRRRFLTQSAAVAAPLLVSRRVFGANDKIVTGCIGMGGRGMADINGFLGSYDVQVTMVCDVIEAHRQRAKQKVDQKYGSGDCQAVNDYRDIVHKSGIDAVMIATPDHWHAIVSIEAMKHGKDVFCEKPETLVVREGRLMVETARRHGRVFSGGSQRVWQDYNWFHKMVKAGRIGEVKECWVGCGGPSRACYDKGEPVPPGLDWNLWLGPAPWVPFNRKRLNFRPWQDYSGGGMTDWGAHKFGGTLFCTGLQDTGPVEVCPPDKDHERLTYTFANGVKFYHGGAWGGLSLRGTEGELPLRNTKEQPKAPDIHIPNYKGRGGLINDFLHCVRTRERPFRDIERAHRTVTVCHLGNIAYWLNRKIKWDPVKEEIVGDPEAARWLDRPRREPWIL
jgi:predicted dehydrogenase